MSVTDGELGETPEETPDGQPSGLERERQKSPKRSMSAAVLTLEAITLGLTTPVLIAIADVDGWLASLIGLGLAVLCILTAGMLRAEWAYGLGWVIQVAAIGLGFVIPLMFFLGGIFAALWWGAVFLGVKIERERAAAFAAFDAEQSGQSGHDGR